jgi:hypothetical protein
MNINHVQQIPDFMAEEEIPKVEAGDYFEE